MRPMFQTPPPVVAAGGVDLGQWSSLVKYLFSGLGVVLGVIAVVLMLLVCSYSQWRSYNQSSLEDKLERRVHILQREMEPRIVVIMAGETIPTHLAKPAPVVGRCEEA